MLKMLGINKSFSGVQVLFDVDFEVGDGEVMALMGENGAGKSTLMKALVGVHTDWTGRIDLGGEERRFNSTREAEEAGISIIYQELNLVSELSVAENIFLGREPTTRWGTLDYARMHRSAREILSDLHFETAVTTPVSQLRVGHQQLVEIGKALSLKTRLVIMDEPTSALSEAESEVLFSVIYKLKSQGVSVVYISHRIEEVFRIADRVTILRDGRTIGIHDTASLDRAELISKMVGREFTQFFIKDSKPGDEVVLGVKHLTRKSTRGNGRALIENISFDLKRGEHLGIAGLLGAGRTELLEALFGVDADNVAGEIYLEGERITLANPVEAIEKGIALITEDRKGNGLLMGKTVAFNMTLAALKKILRYGLISRRKERNVANNYVSRLSIDIPSLENSIETLSGGNQQKVLLAKWLATDPKILLLDEPTRGIDVGAKHEIYLLLSELSKQGISLVLTSSELPELLSICDRILVLREGKLSGNYHREEATQEKIMEAAAPSA